MTPAAATIIDIAGRSILIAAVATAAVLPVAIAVGFFLARHRGRWRDVVDVIVMLPMVLPPVAIGLALMWLLSSRGLGGLLGVELLLTWQAAAVASAIVALPIAARAAEQAFQHVPRRLEHLATALGHDRFTTFRRVVWPHAGPGLIAAALLAFARALGEFGATVLVAGIIPGRTETLSLAIYDRINAGRDGEAWAFAGIATAIAALALVAAQWFRRRLGDRGRSA